MGIEKIFYKNGQIRRIVYKNENGQLHREDGPAFRYWRMNGDVEYEKYYKNGKLHREGGAAIQSWYKYNSQKHCSSYYKHGKMHREDGPCIIWRHPNGEVSREFFCLEDKKLSKQQFEQYEYEQILKQGLLIDATSRKDNK
jgi:uncharacterized protein